LADPKPTFERPGFAKDYPDDADLLALLEAFEAGNYRAVRAGTERIAQDHDKPAPVKHAARDLRSRTQATRFQIGLLVLTAVFVLALSTYEIFNHGHR
jgi:hypothetical protein